MSNFEDAYQKTMGHEGGWVRNPADSGGETYKGVARKHQPKWAGWRLIDNTKAGLLNQPEFGTQAYRGWVKTLNGLLASNVLLQNKVKEFYQTNFWGPLGDIADQRVAEETFDKRVNCGDIALRWLQRAAGVDMDGAIGPKTLEAVNAANPAVLLDAFNESAKHYYERIIERDPSQAQFRRSWFGRLRNYDGSHFVEVV